MNSNDRIILKNASIMLVTQVFTWGLALLATLVFPRYLGTNGLGQLHLAASIWAIVGIISAFGMDGIIVREIARNPTRTGELFASTALIRALFFLVGTIVTLLYSSWAGYSALTMQVIVVTGLSQFVGLMTSACLFSLQGLERMEFSSLGQAIERTLVTITSIVLLLLGYGVLVIALVNVAGSLIGFSIQFSALKRLQVLQFKIDWSMIQWLLKTSFPLLLFSSFIVIYAQIDTILISLLVNEEGVGLYSVTDRLYGTFLFVPSIFIGAAFPALSRLFANDADHFSKLVRKSFDLMILVAVPVGFGLLVIANPLVILLFGDEFQKSGPILTVRAMVLIFTYLNMLFGVFLLSVEKQKPWAIVMGAATLASIPLDLVLVPWSANAFNNGAMGGAFAYLVTESGMFLAALWLLPKGLLKRSNGWYAARVLLAGVGMVSIIFWFRDWMLAMPIALGAVSYLVLLILFRVITKEEWGLLKRLFSSSLHRITGRVAQSAEVS